MTRPRVLVIGGNGFIGSRLIRLMRTLSIPTFGTIHMHSNACVAGVGYEHLELADSGSVRRCVLRVRPEIIIDVAGSRDLGFCEAYPEHAFSVHADATKALCAATADIGAFVTYISTDCVFPGLKRRYSETDREKPINVYGKAKLMGECWVRRLESRSAVVRASLLIGVPLEHQGPNTVMDVLCAIHNGQHVYLPDALYNTPLHVDIAVEAMSRVALERLWGVYHLAGRQRLSRYALGVRAAREFGLNVGHVHRVRKTAGIRPRNAALSTQRLMQDIGFAAPNLDATFARLQREARTATFYRTLVRQAYIPRLL